jgi:hypothetical protein
VLWPAWPVCKGAGLLRKSAAILVAGPAEGMSGAGRARLGWGALNEARAADSVERRRAGVDRSKFSALAKKAPI